MRPNRVDCADCANFEYPELMITIVQGKDKEKCILGKRVMFRSYGHPDMVGYVCGWPRYCGDFKAKSTTVSDDA